jgi:hypothetical protein
MQWPLVLLESVGVVIVDDKAINVLTMKLTWLFRIVIVILYHFIHNLIILLICVIIVQTLPRELLRTIRVALPC